MVELFAGAAVSLAVNEAFQAVKTKIKGLLPQQSLNAALLDILDTVTQDLFQSHSIEISPAKLEEALRFLSPFTFAQLEEYKVRSFLTVLLQEEPKPEHISAWQENMREAIAKNGELYRYLEIVKGKDTSDMVQKVIWQYCDSFTEPLFLHRQDREDKEKNPLVNLTNLYIEPKIENPYTEERGFGSLLTQFLNDRKSNLLFIEGSAAMGKTTLVAWLCYQYLFGDKNLFQNRPLVCVRLREVTMNKRAKDALFDYLSCNESQFSERYGTAVVVLDGADELTMIEGKSAEDFILALQDKFENCKWIITGRKQYLRKDVLKDKGGMQEALLKPFDITMKREWVAAYKEKCKETLSPSVENFILDKNREEDEATDTPLVLYLLGQSKGGEDLRENPWLLYHEIFSSALYQTPYNEPLAEYEVRTHPASEYAEDMYHFLGQISFQMAKDQKHDEYITHEQLIALVKEENTPEKIKKIAEDHREKHDWLDSLCAVCSYCKDNGRGALEFYHNNIRDFFFCEYIYKRIQACLQLENEEDPINAEKFIETVADLFPHRPLASRWREKESTWEQTFLFLLYRLRWEYQQEKEDSLCSIEITKEKNPLPSVLFQLASCPNLLTHLGSQKYNIPPLKQIKTIYLNTLFLSRIWQEIYRANGEIEYVLIWDYKNLLWKRILYSDTDDLLYFISDHVQSISVASYAYLEGAHFEWARLENAHLAGACLVGAHFEYANLNGANLSRADLAEAHILCAQLFGANLAETNLAGANFAGTHIENALNLKKTRNLEYALNLGKDGPPLGCIIDPINTPFAPTINITRYDNPD